MVTKVSQQFWKYNSAEYEQQLETNSEIYNFVFLSKIDVIWNRKERNASYGEILIKVQVLYFVNETLLRNQMRENDTSQWPNQR